MISILVVDDEPKLGKLTGEMLALDGHEVSVAESGTQGLETLAARAVDIVVTDLKMPSVDGMQILAAARAQAVPPSVILMTAFGTAESAVAAMKAGAADYLLKPFSMDELRLRVRRLAEQRRSDAKSSRLLESLTPSLVAESERMKAVLKAARQVAPTDATLLLLGESGTGKSQLARWIHYHSKRGTGPFVEVHCSSLPEALLESELFGHEKGSFTGAAARKEGLLTAAHGGTLFLDEIGEISPPTQVKLLRFMQEREVLSLGSTAARKVDVRVIAATHRDLPAAVKAGGFREDFYYRLNVFQIELPPLRLRPEDILPLTDRYLMERGIPPSSKLTPAVRERLRARRWSGNVRELENALERALILAGEGPLLVEHLDESLGPTAGTIRVAESLLAEGFNLDAFETELLHAALARAGGNKTHAAKLLGISRRRLYSRLESAAARDAPGDEDSTD